MGISDLFFRSFAVTAYSDFSTKAREKYDDKEGCMEQEIRCFVNDYVGINFIMEE